MRIGVAQGQEVQRLGGGQSRAQTADDLGHEERGDQERREDLRHRARRHEVTERKRQSALRHHGTARGKLTGGLFQALRIAGCAEGVNRPGFTGVQNSRRIARYGTDIKEENREAVFT